MGNDQGAQGSSGDSRRYVCVCVYVCLIQVFMSVYVMIKARKDAPEIVVKMLSQDSIFKLTSHIFSFQLLLEDSLSRYVLKVKTEVDVL